MPEWKLGLGGCKHPHSFFPLLRSRRGDSQHLGKKFMNQIKSGVGGGQDAGDSALTLRPSRLKASTLSGMSLVM